MFTYPVYYRFIGLSILTTVDLEKFDVKEVCTARTSTKLKHTRFFTMKILLSNNYYHASSFHSAHSYMLNVCNNNVYDAQTCTSFYYSTDKCMYRMIVL